MTDTSKIWVFYKWERGNVPLLRVRSVRGGPEKEFEDALAAGQFAAHEDSEQAWDDKKAVELRTRGALPAWTVLPAPDIAHGSLLETRFKGRPAYLGLDDAGEPVTALGMDRDDVRNSIPQTAPSGIKR